jgi:transposase
MLHPPPGTRVFLACGVTDMRKGFDGLAALVQMVLAQDPYGGALFLFRGRRGDLVKALWWDGQGLALYGEAPGERPLCVAAGGQRRCLAHCGAASMLVEGIDWRMPAWTARPQATV